MSPRQLALKYLEIFFSGQDLYRLKDLFAPDLEFTGPFHRFNNRDDYVNSLIDDPPNECGYQLLHIFEGDNRVNLIYQFSKPGITTPMSQLFEVHEGRIRRILLIFDTGPFVRRIQQ